MSRIVCFVASIIITMCALAQVPKRFDVLIHELLPDPSPPIGLPNSEFIELRNNSSYTLNLRNWKITDGSSTATITVDYLLQADSCVVVCSAAARTLFLSLGPAIGISNFPSLNNDADMIWLLSPEGRVIHTITYNLSWYQNAVKSEGGWTLEMMDPKNPCTGAGNWLASRDAKGGTPGHKNSVESSNPDKQPPALLRTYAIDSITIAAVFDEPLDSNFAASSINYKLNKGGTVINAIPSAPLFNEVIVTTAVALSKNEVYTIEVSGITDCAGNVIGLMDTARAGLPSQIETGNVIINEILFNPNINGSDYIEFYNSSNKVFDVSHLYIGSRNISGGLSTPEKLSEKPFLLFPGDFIVVSSNAAAIQSQYVTRYPLNMFTIDRMPSLPDDKGNIVLMNEQGNIIDEVSYHEKWHFSLIVNREGIALERIEPGLPTQNKDNWTSAASDVGYGTPTYRNSQYRNIQRMQSQIEVVPGLFSPDNDGLDDHCFIHYELTAPNKLASVTVFDLNGNIVKNLVQNASLSQKGFVRWDGLDNKGSTLPVGVYIILTELFDLQGNRNNFKNLVTLARRF